MVVHENCLVISPPLGCGFHMYHWYTALSPEERCQSESEVRWLRWMKKLHVLALSVMWLRTCFTHSWYDMPLQASGEGGGLTRYLILCTWKIKEGWSHEWGALTVFYRKCNNIICNKFKLMSKNHVGAIPVQHVGLYITKSTTYVHTLLSIRKV